MVRPSTFQNKHVVYQHAATLKPVDYSYRSDIGLELILAGLRTARVMAVLAQPAQALEIYSSVFCDVKAALATGSPLPWRRRMFSYARMAVTTVSNVESNRSDVLQAI